MPKLKIEDFDCVLAGSSHVPNNLIYFDFDDVVTDTAESKRLACNRLFKKDIPAQLLNSSRLSETDLTEEQYKELQRVVYKTGSPDFIIPMEGAIEGINTLLEENVAIGILTARFEAAEIDPIEEMLENLLVRKVPIFGVGYENAKRGAKASVLSALSAIAYYDDDGDMLEAIINSKARIDKCKLHLFDPKNCQKTPAGVEKVTSWPEIVQKYITSH